MDLKKGKQFAKEFAQLNKAARKILDILSRTNDERTRKELLEEFNAVNLRLSEYQKKAPQILEELESPIDDIVTPTQTQRIWDDIREKVRLAKFNDDGIQPPDIDVKKLFAGRKFMTVEEIISEIQAIIDKWEPTTH